MPQDLHLQFYVMPDRDGPMDEPVAIFTAITAGRALDLIRSADDLLVAGMRTHQPWRPPDLAASDATTIRVLTERIQAVHALASEWASRAPAGGWGNGITSTIGADCGRTVLAALAGEPCGVKIIPDGKVTVDREDLRMLLAVAPTYAGQDTFPVLKEAHARLSAAAKGGE